MTRLLFLPNDQTFILLESPLPAEEVVESVYREEWLPPEPYGSSLMQLPEAGPLHAFRQGSLVVITTERPLNLQRRAVATLSIPEKEPDVQLSRRQHQVLQGLTEGLTTKQIALRLGLRPRTVAMHIASLKKRLGAATRAQSVGRAAALGLCKLQQAE